MFDNSCDQSNNWRWDNPSAFGDQVDRSKLQTTSSGQVKPTSQRFSWQSSNDVRAKIEPQRCRQYTPGDFLAVRRLNCDEIFDEDGDDEDWAEHGAPSRGRSRPGDGYHNDNGKV